jgi:hypothetical protein
VTLEAGGTGAAFAPDFAVLVDFAAGTGAVNFCLMAAWMVGMSTWFADWPSMVAYPAIGAV